MTRSRVLELTRLSASRLLLSRFLLHDSFKITQITVRFCFHGLYGSGIHQRDVQLTKQTSKQYAIAFV